MIKLSDVAQAIRDNGIPQTYGTFFTYNDGLLLTQTAATETKPTAACAMGQAAINLNVLPDDLDMILSMTGCDISSIIVEANDNKRLSFEEIAALIEAEISVHDDDTALKLHPDPDLYKWKQSENVLSGV